MLEIKCSKRQKRIIQESLLNPEGCLWPQKKRTCYLDPNMDCKKCFEKNIKWTHPERKHKEVHMDDLISRSELIAAIKRQYCTDCDSYDGLRCRACHADDMLDLVDDMPSIDALKLPCNIGCEVYSIEPIWYYHELHKCVHRGKVVGIEVNAKKHKMVWIHLDLMSEGSAYAMDFEDFGKKIFFSKDEAWSALNQEDAHAAD